MDGPMLIRAVAAATANLEAHVDEVDSLNVFPVPDGDTGSNMLATMRAALAEVERLPAGQRDLDHVAEALSRGALTGARGNSGVILSQIIRGMTQGSDGRRRANGVHLAEGLRRGSETAYGSVLTPVEGTILTVIRDAADAAEAAAGRQPHVEAVLADVIEAAAISVQRTPMLLPVLEDAGVVDSGGQGLYRVLEGMLQVGGLDGSVVPPVIVQGRAGVRTMAHGHGAVHGHGEHGYETEYLLASEAGTIDVEALRAAISAVGGSVVVAGDAFLARVHVHGERPDAAVAAGLAFGRLREVAIRDLDDQVSELAAADPAVVTGVAVVAIAPAPGLASVLRSLGARIVRPAHGTRPSVGEIADGVASAGAPEVVILPNDRDAYLAAGHAASMVDPVRALVIATRNAAEGAAAMLAFDPEAGLDRNIERMSLAAIGLRSFTVFTAARDSVVDGIAIRSGEVLALDADRVLLARGDDLEAATLGALAALDGYELVTLYRGHDVDAARMAALVGRIAAAWPGVETEVVIGGQLHDHLLVAVE